MELTLTKKQAQHLNNTSPIKADALKRVYRKSVEDQQKTLKAAEQIRKKR
jgi:hypothetical protein